MEDQLKKNTFTPLDPEIAEKALKDHFNKVMDAKTKIFMNPLPFHLEEIKLEDVEDPRIKEKIIKLYKKDRDQQIKARLKTHRLIKRQQKLYKKK